MLADSIEELHQMADKIGISRRWFQDKKYKHYDICKSKRSLAISYGAIEINRKQFRALLQDLKREK
jgi:allophanate hydrolase subunit 1